MKRRNGSISRCETCIWSIYQPGEVHPWGNTTAREPESWECDNPEVDPYEQFHEGWGLAVDCPHWEGGPIPYEDKDYYL